MENTKFAYSSEKHLTEITEKFGEPLENFVNHDNISLVETGYCYLENVFQKIITFNFISLLLNQKCLFQG